MKSVRRCTMRSRHRGNRRRPVAFAQRRQSSRNCADAAESSRSSHTRSGESDPSGQRLVAQQPPRVAPSFRRGTRSVASNDRPCAGHRTAISTLSARWHTPSHLEGEPVPPLLRAGRRQSQSARRLARKTWRGSAIPRIVRVHYGTLWQPHLYCRHAGRTMTTSESRR